jgi:primosomal protein N' (replication factor Y)
MIAKVVVDVAVDKEFDYLIPAALEGQVALGSRVNVSFGSRQTQGYVVGFSKTSAHPELKAIESVVGSKPYIKEALLKLARWMGDYYCAPVELAVQAVLPGAVRNQKAKFKEQLFVELVGQAQQDDQPRSPTRWTPVSLPASDRAGDSAVHLEGCLVSTPSPRAPKQAAALALLTEQGGMFLHDLVKQSGADAGTVRALERKGLVRIGKQASLRDPLSHHNILPTVSLALMPEQAAALAVVTQSVDTLQPPVILLHGVTGSGKTEVYLQAIAHALKQGKGAIVLVPEIALTPQTIERFRGRFGDTVAILHSHLSSGERHDEWHRIHDGEALIAIGARSAVFAPVKDLGLIVVDEEHENTYKQEEAPRYNARDVAVMRGRLEGCAVVLGSATPALESFHNARTGKYRLVEMKHRVDHRSMPFMRIVDMRVEAEKTGRVSVFSRDLVEAVRRRLDKAEQVMLFLNRRGYATSLTCPKCGYVAMCGQCSIALTYHRHDELLKCHVCGDVHRVPERCPGCQDPAFKFTGIGTQRVELAVGKIFPGAKVTRMDADATTGKDSHRRILADFRIGKIDILVGTQMIAKGLDFPNVTLIGVLNADTSLHMPDFRAGERTFQLLTQVAGRAGRGELPGEVIVQTFTPFHQAIQAARQLDYDGFCDKEFEFRRELGYPPFGRLLCVAIRGMDEAKVIRVAESFAEQLKPRLSPQVQVAGPAPAPLARAKGQFRYQLILRAPTSHAMTGPIKAVMKDFKCPAGVSFAVDVDAVSLM